ncbi:hypothetical protein CJ195_09455 [Bacillus sp. UMB0899]|uniref:GNAT family N-acetyltransferase n=1 Tax=Metabacillus schmidteae TaxID=2730405 RepID=UPI000C808099|nr:GNAT family N-acetyltransferase [Metabacillus schmidteae]PMC38668.1 hypothetical protein CJ195_09455 [Bacillus sp. UMB0899]
MINWVEIKEGNVSYFEMAMELYDKAFPIEVREPHDIFLRGLQYAQNYYHFLLGFEGDQLVSFATGHYFANINSGFIVYIATNLHARSSGIGSKTLMKIEDLLNNDAISAGNSSIKAIYLETETQELVHTEVEKQDYIKRNRFFSGNNYVKYNEINYLQPPLHDDVKDMPLNLLIKYPGNTNLSKEEIKLAVKTIYKEKYFEINEIDKMVLNQCLRKMGFEEDEFF